MNNNENSCPCGSGSTYSNCCKPYHIGEKPDNAQLLMRSRYSAYALNYPEYIVDTTHPASPQFNDNKFAWKRSISNFSKNTTFQRLEILDFKEKESLATVTFTCHILQEGQDASFTEKSYFEMHKGRWFYVRGLLKEGHLPNMVTDAEIKVLPLAYYDDQILRKKAEPVLEITPEIRKLIESMIETMDACNGIGLAAPQVHYSIRVFVIRTPIEKEDNTFDPGEIEVFINPELSAPSLEKWKAPEGCLSIPTIRSEVERPKEITVSYINLNGKKVSKRFIGWAARVIMHENDHLNGVLFIDRLSPEEKTEIKPILKKINDRIHDGYAL